MKGKSEARLKMFWARKELMPFEHLGSNNVPSFISKDNTTDPGGVERGVRACCPTEKVEKMGFLQLHLLVLARGLTWGQ